MVIYHRCLLETLYLTNQIYLCSYWSHTIFQVCCFFLFCDPLLPWCFADDHFLPLFALLFPPNMIAGPLPANVVVLFFMKSSLTIGSMIAPKLVITLGFVIFFTTPCVFHVCPIGVRMQDSNCAVFWNGNGSWLTYEKQQY